MKHDKYELTYKKFIKAEKRLNEIYKEIRELPYTKLKEPYQSGWNLIPVLRDDYMRSSKGSIVKILIDTFGVSSYTRTSKIISQIRKNPSLHNCRKLLGENLKYWGGAPYIRNISKKEYIDLSDHFKKYFDELSPLAKQYKKGDYELNIPTHYIVIKVEKRIITHKKDINSTLLSEKAELQKILAPYWRMGRYDGYYRYFENRSERRKSKVQLTKIELE